MSTVFLDGKIYLWWPKSYRSTISPKRIDEKTMFGEDGIPTGEMNMKKNDDGMKRLEMLIIAFRQEFQEQNKRWKKNDQRWASNEKRWEKNDQRWASNEKRWEKNDQRWVANEKSWEDNDRKWEITHKKLDQLIEIQHNMGLLQEEMQSDLKVTIEILQETRDSTLRIEKFQPLYDNHEQRIRQLEFIVSQDKT